MSNLEELLQGNREWAESVKKDNPDFFINSAKAQNPKYLWIGCSDSRVPANQIVGLNAGDVFVHRNIANVVVHTDLNALSVIQFAVQVLKVEHVIVCGHYGCGGIKAALENEEHGLIDNWLRHIKDVYRMHEDKFENVSDPQKRANLMCELNVIEQVQNVCHTTIMQKAWKSNANVTVHGLIYSISDGILKDLNVSVSSLDDVNESHRLK